MTNRIKYILGLMTICILGVILTQGFWLYKDYKYYSGQPLLSSDFDVLMPTHGFAKTRMVTGPANMPYILSGTLSDGVSFAPRIAMSDAVPKLVAVATLSAMPSAAQTIDPSAVTNIPRGATHAVLGTPAMLSTSPATQTTSAIQTADPYTIAATPMGITRADLDKPARTARPATQTPSVRQTKPEETQSVMQTTIEPAVQTQPAMRLPVVTGRYYDYSESGTAKLYQAIPYKAPVSYVLQKMKLQFGASILLILVTTSCFIYMLITIFTQRKLSIVKNDMINNMTHELKTPLSTVSVAIEALRNYEVLNDKDKTKLYLEMSKNEVDHLSKLIEMILELSIFESHKMVLFKKMINVNFLIQDIIKKYTLSGINLQLDSSEVIPDLFIDPVHLRNAIRNLIENAIKYSAGKPEIHILSMYNKGMWTLIIRDNGIGIPESYQKSVFDQFFRVPGKRLQTVKGYGLGLSYVKQVVERHNGTISLYSQEGKGSTFTILMPIR